MGGLFGGLLPHHALKDHLTAVDSGFGPQVYQAVGRTDNFRVVLHNHHRVANVP